MLASSWVDENRTGWGAVMIGVSRIAIALISLFAVGSASAADQAVRKAPPAVAPYSWTGVYVGVNAGGTWGAFDPTTATAFSPLGYFAASSVFAINIAGLQSINPATFTGGVQAGFNWQMGGIVVLGGEIDFNSFHLSGSTTGTSFYPCCVPAGFTISSSAHTDWLFTARSRLGIVNNNWPFNTNSLIYVTGGLAVTNLNGSFAFTDNCGSVPACGGGFPPAAEAASLSKTKLGYTVGAGVEAGLWGNWSLKAEYLYVKFNSESVTGFITTPAIIGFGSNNNPFTQSIDLKAHIARLGLNYRFGGPAVAGY